MVLMIFQTRVGEREDHLQDGFVEAISLTFGFRYFSHFSDKRKMAASSSWRQSTRLANGETGRDECEETKYNCSTNKATFHWRQSVKCWKKII